RSIFGEESVATLYVGITGLLFLYNFRYPYRYNEGSIDNLRFGYFSPFHGIAANSEFYTSLHQGSNLILCYTFFFNHEIEGGTVHHHFNVCVWPVIENII